MSEVSPESALELQKAILQHDTWNEQHMEMAGDMRLGFLAISGGGVTRNQLPSETLSRLGVTEIDADDGSRYQIDLGRRLDGRFDSVGDMLIARRDTQDQDPSYGYEDLGPGAAFLCIGRVGVNALVRAYFVISTKGPSEPGQPPRCSVKVELEDHMPMRQLTIGLGKEGGNFLDMAKAMNLDLTTGEQDLDLPEVNSNTKFKANLAKERGESLSEAEIAALQEDEIVTAEMQAMQPVLHSLTTNEILGLATIAQNVRTSVIF